MPTTSLRRRLLAVSLAAAMMGATLLGASTAAGDPVADKQAEARRIATQLDAMQQRVEILAERYNDARIRLAEVDRKVAAAHRRVDRTKREIAQRRRDLARFAVSAYTSSGDDGTLDVVLNADRAEYSRREGYAAIAARNKNDLVDALRAARNEGEATVGQLQSVRRRADRARAGLKRDRASAEAAVSRLQRTSRQVQGELKTLIAAEQARRAAEEARRAAAAIRRAAVAAVAQAAAAPAPQPRRAHTTPSTAAANPTPRSTRRSAPATTRSATTRSAPAQAAPAAGRGAGAAIAAARSQLGVAYQWGGASPSGGFDCSGLVMWAWAQGGKSLPHSSSAQYSMATKISVSALQPGDLVFYGSPVHHVALYIGGGQIIHAPHTGDVVKISSVSYWSDLAGAGRI